MAPKFYPIIFFMKIPIKHAICCPYLKTKIRYKLFYNLLESLLFKMPIVWCYLLYFYC